MKLACIVETSKGRGILEMRSRDKIRVRFLNHSIEFSPDLVWHSDSCDCYWKALKITRCGRPPKRRRDKRL